MRFGRCGRGQGAMEYLLLVGAATLVTAAVAYAAVSQGVSAAYGERLRAAEQVYMRGLRHDLPPEAWFYPELGARGNVKYWYVNDSTRRPNYLESDYPLRDIHGGAESGQYEGMTLKDWYEQSHV